jgi:crotonobetainyl-CoA:carnitine CoA-transferase CaiB-like acyl-CoA transferase
MASAPLEGIKVLDLSQMLAGPGCAQMLGDQGADVIKVEPLWGERQRLGPVPIDEQTSYTFLAYNRNKRSISLDLSTDDGVQVLYRLVENADVFIQNYRAETVDQLGISYDRLMAINRRLVYASISGYGDRGPFSGLPGQDLQLQAFSGLISVTGYPDEPRPSTPAGSSVTDNSAAMLCAFGIATALIHRERTGRGQEVKTSLLAGGLLLQEPLFTTYLSNHQLPRKAENGHPMSPPPYGVWRAGDGKEFASSATIDDESWAEFCALVDRPQLIDDPRFSTGEARRQHHTELFAIIDEALAHETRDEWLRLFRAAGVWVTPVHNYEELCASSHLRDNDLVVDMTHPTGEFTALNTPISLSDTPREVRRPPPRLGEHTREVLEEAGYEEEAIEALFRSGVVA